MTSPRFARVGATIGLRLCWFCLPLWLGGCASETPPASPLPTVEVTVSKPLVIPLVEWDEYIGRLDPIEDVEVRARVSGYLESIHFEEGQIVERGDLLVIIDPRPFQAALNAAEARLTEANAQLEESKARLHQAEAELADAEARVALSRRRFERGRLLLGRNAIAQEELDVLESEQVQAVAATEAARARIESAKAGIATSEAGIATARANVEAAALDLQYTEVRAPVNGRISRRIVTEGNLISGGTIDSTLLTTIVSLDPIHVYFDANEQEFLKYVRLARSGRRASSREVKNPVYVALIDEDGFPHQGHMDFVDNRIDPNTGTMRGRAILPNDDGTLTPGLFVKLRLPGSGRYEAVLIPDAAIQNDQSERFVYVVAEDGSVERRPVRIGPIAHGLRVIRSGLDGTEQVVTQGVQRILPGATVKATEEQLEAEPSDLPDDYQPVPREQWLNPEPDRVPNGVEPNAAPYRAAKSPALREEMSQPEPSTDTLEVGGEPTSAGGA